MKQNEDINDHVIPEKQAVKISGKKESHGSNRGLIIATIVGPIFGAIIGGIIGYLLYPALSNNIVISVNNENVITVSGEKHDVDSNKLYVSDGNVKIPITNAPTTSPKQLWLEDKDPFKRYGEETYSALDPPSYTKAWDMHSHKDNLGKEYSHGLFIRNKGNHMLANHYDMDNEYNGIKGWYIIEQTSKNTETPNTLKFYSVDENDKWIPIAEPITIKGGDRPKDFDVSLSGVNTLRIEITSKKGAQVSLGLVDTFFY